MAGLFPGESRERDYSLFDWSYPRDFSADGEFVLFTEASGTIGTYLRKTDGLQAVRLGRGSSQALSADGRLAVAIRPGRRATRRVPNRREPARLLPKGLLKHVAAPVVCLPDNMQILFMGRGVTPQLSASTFKTSRLEIRRPSVLLAGRLASRCPQTSPRSRRLSGTRRRPSSGSSMAELRSRSWAWRRRLAAPLEFRRPSPYVLEKAVRGHAPTTCKSVPPGHQDT